jgi:hypothetical protein
MFSPPPCRSSTVSRMIEEWWFDLCWVGVKADNKGYGILFLVRERPLSYSSFCMVLYVEKIEQDRVEFHRPSSSHPIYCNRIPFGIFIQYGLEDHDGLLLQ